MGRPRSQEARERAMTAAAEIALELGLPATTIDEVARRSGVAKTTIYRHFDDRNGLLVAALDRVTDAPRTPDTGSLHRDLVEFYIDLIPIFADEAVQKLSLEIFAAAARDPHLQAMQQSFFSGRMGPIHTIMRHAYERGDLTPTEDFALVLEAVHGPLIIRSLTAPESLASLDPERLAVNAVDRLVATT
ncbi:MAG: TetR/AcrR family transcriptional regulator [Ilumatobacter sp.]